MHAFSLLKLSIVHREVAKAPHLNISLFMSTVAFLCLQCRSLPMRKEKNELLMDVFYVPSFFCLHISD